MSRIPKSILFVLLGIVAALSGALLAQRVLQNTPTTLALQNGTLVQPPKAIPDFALVDHTSAPFTAARLQDRWTLMFFGFANCADVCPTTLALLSATAKTLADLAPDSQPQLVFVSVDSHRDTPERLKAYINPFGPAFIAVTGTQSNLDTFTKSLGVPSAIRPLENGGYAVDHYAGILAFNPQGELRALFGAPHTVETLAGDYRMLIGASR